MRIPKRDNANLESKLELRRYFLRKYHREGKEAKVLDCFEGEQKIWTALKSEFDILQYFGVDKKKARLRLRIASEKLLEKTEDYNVLDLDCYGSPWIHFLNFLKIGPQSASVFMTIGGACSGALTIGAAAFSIFHPELPRLKMPHIMGHSLSDSILPFAFLRASQKGWEIAEALEAFPQKKSARYIGLFMRRKKDSIA